MTRKSSASSPRVKPRAKSVKYIPDSQLDLTDIPEATDEQLRRARRVGRPTTGTAKHLIAIHISPNVLWKLRRLAAKQSKPYQTYIHELLERAVRNKVA
jgi:predicted DNA binding CopG/RHH family protein